MSDLLEQSMSILVVEDDPGDFGLIRVHLGAPGWRHEGAGKAVLWATSLPEGVAMARRDKPDVMILDLTLPDSSGLATVRAMRAALPDVPVVVLTGRDDNELALAALQAGAQDYLIKGQFEHDALGRAVRHALVRARLEGQLRESQKMQAIGTLAGGIAREFNNAVATILGNVELAREDVGSNTLALESLEEIRKAGTRARDLVQQILAVSRRQPTERKLTALGPVLEETAQLLRAALPSRLALEVRCAPGVPAVLADASQIKQILLNLATNAMQAIQGGPGHIAIRLDTVVLDAAAVKSNPALHDLQSRHARHLARAARITMSDDGPGIDPATVGRLFEPFFSTKKGDHATGLGLAVVRGIVLGHDGAIAVESTPGKGATFTIYLPEGEALAGAQASAKGTPIAAPVSSPGASARILYIDDDDSLVLLVKRLLERRGLRVTGYTEPADALAALRADPAGFDLVVSDYNMPGMSGLDVAREVRAIRADLAVAIASGFIDEDLRAQAFGVGVRELVFKADTAEDLCEALVRLAQMVGVASGSH